MFIKHATRFPTFHGNASECIKEIKQQQSIDPGCSFTVQYMTAELTQYYENLMDEFSKRAAELTRPKKPVP